MGPILKKRKPEADSHWQGPIIEEIPRSPPPMFPPEVVPPLMSPPAGPPPGMSEFEEAEELRLKEVRETQALKDWHDEQEAKLQKALQEISEMSTVESSVIELGELDAVVDMLGSSSSVEVLKKRIVFNSTCLCDPHFLC